CGPKLTRRIPSFGISHSPAISWLPISGTSTETDWEEQHFDPVVQFAAVEQHSGAGAAAAMTPPVVFEAWSGAIPVARIRARCAAAWVFAQGKSGPLGKYWTSSCMYRPDGSVIPW